MKSKQGSGLWAKMVAGFLALFAISWIFLFFVFGCLVVLFLTN